MYTRTIGRTLGLTAMAMLLGVASENAIAANPAGQQTGHASAVILTAILVTETTPMNFADIFQTVTTTTGTVTLTPAGAISGANFNFFGTPVAGAFNAKGTANAPASISFSSGDTLASGTNTIGMGTYQTNASATPVFDATGNLNFNVGATLTIGASQAAGNYSGTYTVTVNY